MNIILQQRPTRPTSTQVKALLSELESNPRLALGRPKGRDNQRQSASLWRQISKRINNLENGCTKSYKQWQKFWRDKKSAVRKHIATSKAEGQIISAPLFSNLELRIIRLLERVESEQEVIKSFVADTDNDKSDLDDMIQENVEGRPTEVDFIPDVKSEPCSSIDSGGRSSRCSNTYVPNSVWLPNKRRRQSFISNNNLSRTKLIHKLLKMEKRRSDNEEKATNALVTIAACMKKQEELMQKISSILLHIVPGDK